MNAEGAAAVPNSRSVRDLYPLVRPLLHRLDPERAHELALRALELGLVPPRPAFAEGVLATEFLGTRLAHPLGLAAGFDKNARVVTALFAQGFSFVEVGGVTPRPQSGNPRPRVFRLPADRAIVNRMGFPGDGMEAVAKRLGRVADRRGMLGVNLAANADSAEPERDFVTLALRFAPLADYLALDVSCPNTANGQVFLEPERLARMLSLVRGAFDERAPRLVAKLSPDIEDARLDAIVDVLLDARVDAIAISNTTATRPRLRDSAVASERGGLSGPPLFALATAALARVARRAAGRVPLVGIGGIASGADAYAKIRAGASVLQLYTALVYEGPSVLARIARELAALLHRDGFDSIAAAVGADVDVTAKKEVSHS